MGEEYYYPSPDQAQLDSTLRADLESGRMLPYKDANSELAKWQLEIEDIIEEQKHDWRGEIKNINGEYIKIPNAKPVMNEMGIQRFTSLMRQSSKNLFLSNFQVKDIKQILYIQYCNLYHLLLDRHEEFELDVEDFSLVANPIKMFIESGIRRSLDAGERKSLTESTKSITTTMNRPFEEMKKRGWFG